MDNKRKCKVTFIHPDLGIGGAERLILDVAVALAEEGHEVNFITNHYDESHAFEELQQKKFPVRVVGDWIPRGVCGLCQALCAYIRMIYLSLVYILFIRRKEKSDIYFIDQIPMAVPFIKLAGGSVIYYCHHPDLLASPPGGTLKKLYRAPINWLELKGTACADIILVNSKYTASVFRSTFPQIRKDIQILYPTISSSYQSTISQNKKVKRINELVPEINTSGDSVIFLSINRYHPAKKLELALDGLEALKSKVSSKDWNRVHLIIAGGFDPQSSVNASYFQELVNLATEKNLTTNLTFMKSPSDSMKADLLLACDCLIYTPINEHFGIVPLEAMTASKPVIACNSGGPCETVEDNVTGYLCDPTGDSLADAMLKMLDKNNCQQAGRLGKLRLAKYFSHATFVQEANYIVTSAVFGSSIKGEVAIRKLLQKLENLQSSDAVKDDVPIKDKIDLEAKEIAIKNESRNSSDGLDVSLDTTTETSYLSPLSNKNLSSISNDSNNQSTEIAEEATP